VGNKKRLDVGGKVIQVLGVLGEIGWGGEDWINLAQDRALVNTVMRLWIP
jgi:hypothetical protein